jgi:DNA-binding NarL/FixJ family response regulator
VSTRILIVDDHEIVRSGLRRLVERQSGWEVCGEAVNGKEAIDKALALNPDLVLMDISMPVMNGIEATRQIRRLSPVTKIVIVSLRDDESITAEAKKAGADAYVVKACASEILLETIAAVLGEG